MNKAMLKRIGTGSLAAVVALGVQASALAFTTTSVFANETEDLAPETTVETVVDEDTSVPDNEAPIATLLTMDDESEDAVVEEQVVHFVTGWDTGSNTGGFFKVQNASELPVTDGMTNAVYQTASNTKDDGSVASVAIWTLTYAKDAVIGTLPELTVESEDVFTEWVDEAGSPVTAETVAADGAIYYASYDSGVTSTYNDMIQDLLNPSDEPETEVPDETEEVNITVTYVLDTEKGSFVNTEAMIGEFLHNIALSDDGSNFVLTYAVEGALNVIPEVKANDGYEFTGWFDESGAAVTSDTEVKDGATFAAGFETVPEPTEVPDPDPTEASEPTEKPDEPEPTEKPTEVPTETPEPTETPAETTDPTQTPTEKPSEAPEPTKEPEVINPSPIPVETNTEPSTQPTEASQNENDVTYVLRVVDTTGAAKNVSVKGSKTLSELANALGYTSVGSWAVKQANITEYKIDGSTTIQTLVDLFKNGDVEVIAYNPDGTVLGCAVAKQTTQDNVFDVTLSKDTNVALRTASEIQNEKNGTDGKGKGEGETNTVSNEGKSDATATPVQTSDSMAWMIYGGIAVVLIGLIAAYVVYIKKFRK